jgi:hypothetical protein
MPSIIIDIDNRDVARVRNAVSKNFNRKSKVPNPSFDNRRPEHPISNPRQIDNPESEDDFINRIIREFLIEHVKSAEIKEARRQASENINPEVKISKGRRR